MNTRRSGAVVYAAAMSDPAGIIDTGDPRDLANVVHRRQAAYDEDPTAENERRLQVAIRQAQDASVSVGNVDNRVDLDDVVARRQAAVDEDPSERNQRRLAVAIEQRDAAAGGDA